MNSDERIPVWVMYDHPIDFPDSFVCRQWWLTIPEEGEPFEESAEVLFTVPTLNAAHRQLPKDLKNIVQAIRELMGTQLDRKIVEIWL